mmetsp:Transcript_8437/g.21763  ORF Transcript_8437/g.21763 Transcript_8437/m.21763 type:complete len:142 (+) Transcript_8437:44-469(+)
MPAMPVPEMHTPPPCLPHRNSRDPATMADRALVYVASQCMCRWGEWEDSQALRAGASSKQSSSQAERRTQSPDLPFSPPARLIAQIHDELLFECDGGRCSPLEIGRRIKEMMEGVGPLKVPLVANVTHGVRWGSLKPLEGL